MVERESNTFEGTPQIPELFYEMGARMKKHSTWLWVVLGAGLVSGFFILVAGIVYAIMQDDIAMIVFFSILGFFGLIMSCLGLISLIIYFKYLVSVKDIRDATGDPVFEKVYQYLILGFILQFVGLSVVTLILNILLFIELEKWAIFMEKKLPTPEMKNVTEGYKWMKIGTIASIIVPIAVFIMPVAYAKVGNAFMAEYNSSNLGGFGVDQPYPLQ